MHLGKLIGPELREALHDDPDEVRDLLEELHPEDVADLAADLEDSEAAKLIGLFEPGAAAEIFERLEEDRRGAIAAELGIEQTAEIAGEMSADERADLFQELPEEMGERVLETLERIDPEAAEEVEELSRWPERSAGGLMTTDYLSVVPEMSVAEVIAAIRAHGKQVETIYYVYVLVGGDKLQGVVSLRDLLLADNADRMADVLTENVITVPPDMDQEEVARRLGKYDLNAIPVVDARGVLLGVITADDIMDVLTQEQTEDVQKLAAVEPLDAPYFQTTFWTFIQKRAPWLVVLFVEEFFTGSALRHYDDVIQAVAKLSYYVPLLISTGGNSGSQSASLIIRGIAVGEIKPSDWWRIAVRELGQGLVLGLILAIVGIVRVYMWGDGPRFAALVGLTLISIVVTGCVVGALLPLAIRRLGFDPATSSTPFIASLVDVLGIIVYFNIAQLVLAEVLAAAH